jgi:hypothetical protein
LVFIPNGIGTYDGLLTLLDLANLTFSEVLASAFLSQELQAKRGSEFRLLYKTHRA